jgi:DNA-binding NarL/FixJ family response regulator
MVKHPRIIVAEDHPVQRADIIDLLNESNITVAGTATNGFELLDVIKHYQPDVILLDLDMPELDGSSVFQLIKQRFPTIKIIICSIYDSKMLVDNFRQRKADAYLPKWHVAGNSELLIKTINQVIAGEKCFYYYDRKSKSYSYTNRELEIIPMLCNGLSTKEIADRLHVGEKAIEKHRKNLYEKMNVNTFGKFLKEAIRNGLTFLR